MPKFYIEFTEESTRSMGYYIVAPDEDLAFEMAEEKYYNFDKPDSQSTHYSKTLEHKVEEA